MRSLRPMLWIPVALALTACGVEDHVVVELEAVGMDPTAELDTLELTITASRTTAGDELCQPYTTRFALDSSGGDAITLPYALRLEPGSLYDKLVYVRVVGLRDGTVRYKTERMASLSGGDVRMQVQLTADCLGVGTGERRHCVGGAAEESPYWRIFDEGEFVQAGEACRVE